MREQTRERLYWGVIAIELLVFVVWQCAHLGGFQWGSDEGIYLMRVRLMQLGYRLYRDIWTDQLPGLIELLRATFALLGTSVEAGRALIVLLTTAGLLGVASLCHTFRARAGGVLAVAALALAPNLFWLSRAMVSPDLPSISLGALSLALMALHLKGRRLVWLAASGLSASLALYVKATAVLALVPAGLWLLADAWSRRKHGLARWGPLLLWLACLAGPLAVGLALHSPRHMWAQFVGTQLVSGQMELKIGPHAVKILAYLGENNWGMASLALAGILAAWRHARGAVGLGLSWLAVSLLVLLVRSPMWPSHHLIVLLPPLAMLGALAISTLWTTLERNVWSTSGLLACAGALAYAASLPGIVVADGALLAPKPAQSSEAAIAYLQERFPDGAVVISDYHMIPFRAGCTVPPALATVTKKRIQLGLLTAQDLIDITERAQPGAILFWDEQLDRATEYVSWVKSRYTLGFKWNYHDIYVAIDDRMILHRKGALLGDAVRLVGYDTPHLVADPGQTLEIVLYWQATIPLDARLSSFVHVVDSQGRQIGLSDHLAWGEAYPSTLWQVGEIVADRHVIDLVGDAHPGVYWFSVGLHDQAESRRLDVVDEQGRRMEGGQVVLGANPVVRWEARYESPPIAQPLQVRAADVADLVGWRHTLSPDGQILDVELVWRARTPPYWPSYAVFAHLYEGEQMIAQHDSAPSEGMQPTIAWREGEYIVDRHPIALQEVDYASPLQLAVGLYDPATWERTPLYDAHGVRLEGDQVRLEVALGAEGAP